MLLPISAVVLISAATLPASADTTGATITLTGGALSITAPADAGNLGTRANTVLGGTVSGALGQVQVNDARSAVAGSGWVATGISTAFTPPTGPAIAASTVSYAAGTITKVGTATYTANNPRDMTGVGASRHRHRHHRGQLRDMEPDHHSGGSRWHGSRRLLGDDHRVRQLVAVSVSHLSITLLIESRTDTRRCGFCHCVARGPFRREHDVEAGAGPGVVAEVAAVRGGCAGGLLVELLDEGVLDAEDAVADLSSCVTATKMWVTSVRRPGALTMKCRWDARIGERPTACEHRPTGPSCGIGYGVGVRRPEPVAAVPSVKRWARPAARSSAYWTS